MSAEYKIVDEEKSVFDKSRYFLPTDDRGDVRRKIFRISLKPSTRAYVYV